MRSPRAIYAATALLLLLIGTVSVLVYRATERDVVSAFSEQQLAVARTVGVALDADVKALGARLRQLNALPSVQVLDVPHIGERVEAAFAPGDARVLQHVVRIGASEELYAWSMRGELLRNDPAPPLDANAWTWFADRAHAGELRIGPVWWDAAAPAYHRALCIPVWRIATSSEIARPPNDFNGVLAFVIDLRELLANYAAPASIQAMRGTLALVLSDRVTRLHIGVLSPPARALDAMRGAGEGTALVDGQLWAWSHPEVAGRQWGVTIGTPYDVAAARISDSGLRQLALVGVLLVLVPVVGWLLVRRERAAEEERRLLQEHIAEAQRMDAIGKLAGGVAHDFNNLLTAILGYTTLIVEDAQPGTPIHDHAVQVRRAAESATALTQKLLAFGRRQVLNTRQVDPARLLNEIMQLVRRLVGEHVRVVADFQPNVWPVVADRVQVEQAIVNLAVNARDAMPSGGTLEIVARNAPRPHGESRPDRVLPPGDYVQIIVRDNGIGMDDATRAKMFEPFFTTKPKGKGTGLGLASVWGIVKQSGGYIHVESTPGVGTTIELLLPRAKDVVAPEKVDGDVTADYRGAETILLVDDERGVRDFACTALERMGYHVLSAEGGEDALRIAQEYQGRIALLVTDVRMPGLQGPELALKLRALRPGLRVLFMSGYAAEGITADMLKDTALLEKPFLPSALTRAVRQELERPD